MSIQKKALVLLLLLSLHAHGAALAKTETWDVNNGLGYIARATVFGADLPQDLRQVLDANGFKGFHCYCGALREYIYEETMTRDSPTAALVALEDAGQRTLVGLQLISKREWIISHLGPKSLLQGREFYITITDLDNVSTLSLGSRFSVMYPRSDGGMESYGFDVYPPWYVRTYESVNAQGKGIAILNGFPYYGFRLAELPFDTSIDNLPYHRAYVPLWPEYMTGITDFPTSWEGAKRVAQASWKRFDGADLAIAHGANLREKAAGSSKWLGALGPGALVHVLDQQKGPQYPWYHVRVGELEGWISGPYVKFPGTEDFDAMMWYLPLSLARAKETVALRSSPDLLGGIVMEIPKDTLIHMMLALADDWLYVMVPRGAISREMDVDGAAGYIRADDVAMVVQSY